MFSFVMRWLGQKNGWRRLVMLVAATLALAHVAACEPQQAAPPPPPPYKPSYAYASTSPSKSPTEVTIAVINPIVKGSVYGTDGAEMLKALPTALDDLITAKGMHYRGPFEKVDEMTFPDKQASDFGLYAELEVSVGWQPQKVQQNSDVSAWNGAVTTTVTCDASVTSSGKVSFVLIEPMSGETIWRKTVPIELQPAVLQGTHDGHACSGPQTSQQQAAAFAAMTGQAPPPSSAAPPLDGEFGNTYRKQLELTFIAMMQGIDKYMSAEEFASLKAQSAELKAKKAY